ncbi:MAG: polyphosphate kinase 2 family protein [Bacteriovoracaceae bacterium]
MSHQSLSELLKDLDKKPKVMPGKDKLDEEIEELQLKMLKVQQAVFHLQERVVIIFEGFDAAGKGGTIRTITEKLDPRSIKVIPIAAPKKIEQGKHWLYRFWRRLPPPGHITIFDRSWYGRVLVEKVDKLTPSKRLEEAYDEINAFEEMLTRDGIILIKIFLAISKKEQLERFEERLEDPLKQWKISEADIHARKKWNDYVGAVDEFMKKNSTKKNPWHLVPSNSKRYARRESLKVIGKVLLPYLKGFENTHIDKEQKRLLKELRSC